MNQQTEANWLNGLTQLSIATLVLVGVYMIAQGILPKLTDAHVEYLKQSARTMSAQTELLKEQSQILSTIARSTAEQVTALKDVLHVVQENRDIMTDTNNRIKNNNP